jgi:hypothetical protein
MLRSLVIASCLISTQVLANDYHSPDMEEYYQSLNWPDNPAVPCCGSSDAYYADVTEPCPKGDDKCALVAVITDNRPDLMTLPDGRTIRRYHVDVGTKVVIPKIKIRKNPIPNPTDHNVLFYSVSTGVVYCWEPTSGI